MKWVVSVYPIFARPQSSRSRLCSTMCGVFTTWAACFDAFRLREVMLCGITAVPPSPEMHKTALGAEDSVDWRHFDATADALAELRERGVKVCVLEQCRRSVALQDFVFEPGSEYALVLGHEVHGVAQSVVDAADVVLEIPQFGTKHSLNVSVAAGMAMWEIVRKGRFV